MDINPALFLLTTLIIFTSTETRADRVAFAAGVMTSLGAKRTRSVSVDICRALEFSLDSAILRSISQNSRAVFEFFHISNAGFATKDPGTNNVLAVFEQSIPDLF